MSENLDTEAGWQDRQQAQDFSGQPLVYSGYYGRPVPISQLPAYEAQAYGFTGFGGGGGFSAPSTGGFQGPGAQLNQPQGQPSAGGSWYDAQRGGGSGTVGGGNGSSWGASWGPGANTAYPQAAQSAVEAMYARMRKRSENTINTTEAQAGRFSGGVRTQKMADADLEMNLNEKADVLGIWNNWQQQGAASGSSKGNGPNGFGGPWGGGSWSPLPGYNPMPGSGSQSNWSYQDEASQGVGWGGIGYPPQRK